MELVLIHGMGRTPLSMVCLKYRLQQLGHQPHLFGYLPTFESLERVTTRLIRFIHTHCTNKTYGLIGHSLGSVIIRHALLRLHHPPAVCCFLAPPILACRAAKFFAPFWLYRLLTGEMGQLLGKETFMEQLTIPKNFKIYVGTSGPRANWFPLGNEINDGLLTVKEATGKFKHYTVTVPALHSFIMNSRTVLEDMVNYLKQY